LTLSRELWDISGRFSLCLRDVWLNRLGLAVAGRG
jgi:hypothetical protein